MEFNSRIEVELKCPHCGQLYLNAVLLSCSHSLCLSCALSLQTLSSTSHLDISSPSSDVSVTSHRHRVCDVTSPSDVSVSSHRHRVCDVILTSPSDVSMTSHRHRVCDVTLVNDVEDKSSVTSETDSGVDSGSRPNSYVGTPSIGNLSIQSTGSQESNPTVTCPRCSRVSQLDTDGASGLPRNVSLEAIVQRYRESRDLPVLCQSCHRGEGGSMMVHSARSADIMCEQCETFYCYDCIEGVDHNGHNLLKISEGCSSVLTKHRTRASRCGGPCESADNSTMFCESCRSIICNSCALEIHPGHTLSQAAAVAKVHKTDLSQQLHVLSEKIKSGAEFVKHLKSVQETIEHNRREMEELVTAECAALIECIERRRRTLLEELDREAQRKRAAYRDQISLCSGNVQRSTGLLQYSIELLKDPDPAAFLQTSGSVGQRVSETIQDWIKEIQFEKKVTPQFEWSFDIKSAQAAVDSLSFQELRIPEAPTILIANSFADNNTISISWADSEAINLSTQRRHGREYVLEIDQGMENKFKQVYRGKEKICTVEGLHFDTDYRLRVKTLSGGGASQYSQYIILRTAREAYFTFDTTTAQADVLFSNDNMTVTSSSFDDRVVLGGVALSRGVHYWEVCVDRFENNKDPAFGVAQYNVTRDRMLGKDDRGWSMYVDSARSWFMHRGQHTGRTDGGIRVSSVVGVLLDLTRGTLRFYLNGEPHGTVAFTDLPGEGPYYPAVSLNRNIQLTLQTGLSLPADYESDN